MDPITHGALGAACAQAFLFNKDKKNAWIVGALAAMAPDLDIYIRSSQDPMLQVLFHRYFTHALIFIPIGALIVALVLGLLKRFRLQWRYTYLAALIGYGTHGLLDACTNYGTVLYWPFSTQRVSWDLISIVDPFFTIPLILGLVWAQQFQQRKGIWIGLACSGLFLTFNSVQHFRSFDALQQYVQNKPVTHLRSFPKLLSSRYWRGIVQTKDKQMLVFTIHTPIFSATTLKLIKRYPLFSSNNLPNFIKNTPSRLRDYQLFTWFTNDYVIRVDKNNLTLADGRFLLDDNPNVALWGVIFFGRQTPCSICALY